VSPPTPRRAGVRELRNRGKRAGIDRTPIAQWHAGATRPPRTA
jgi:hypothetical protein